MASLFVVSDVDRGSDTRESHSHDLTDRISLPRSHGPSLTPTISPTESHSHDLTDRVSLLRSHRPSLTPTISRTDSVREIVGVRFGRWDRGSETRSVKFVFAASLLITHHEGHMCCSWFQKHLVSTKLDIYVCDIITGWIPQLMNMCSPRVSSAQ
jgi:hypothetical protein